MAIAGVGSGALVAALPASAAAGAPPDRTGFATGMTNATKTIGGAIASAIFAIALASTGSLDDPTKGHAPLSGYLTVWSVCAVAALLAAAWAAPDAAPPYRAAGVLSRTCPETASWTNCRYPGSLGGHARASTGASPDRTPERDERTGRGAAAASGSSTSSEWVDLQIRQAMERGDFDNLPGAGKPIKDLGTQHDPDWWIKKLVEREKITGVLPPALQLRKDDAELDAQLDRHTAESEVRRELEEFNARVMKARYTPVDGPPLVTMPRDVEAEVDAWRERRLARRRAAGAAGSPRPSGAETQSRDRAAEAALVPSRPLTVGSGHARAPTVLRVLRRRPAARQRGRTDLHLRVHVLRTLRRRGPRRSLPELRGCLRAPADPAAGRAARPSGLDHPRGPGHLSLTGYGFSHTETWCVLSSVKGVRPSPATAP